MTKKIVFKAISILGIITVILMMKVPIKIENRVFIAENMQNNLEQSYSKETLDVIERISKAKIYTEVTEAVSNVDEMVKAVQGDGQNMIILAIIKQYSCIMDNEPNWFTMPILEELANSLAYAHVRSVGNYLKQNEYEELYSLSSKLVARGEKNNEIGSLIDERFFVAVADCKCLEPMLGNTPYPIFIRDCQVNVVSEHELYVFDRNGHIIAEDVYENINGFLKTKEEYEALYENAVPVDLAYKSGPIWIDPITGDLVTIDPITYEEIILKPGENSSNEKDQKRLEKIEERKRILEEEEKERREENSNEDTETTISTKVGSEKIEGATNNKIITPIKRNRKM